MAIKLIHHLSLSSGKVLSSPCYIWTNEFPMAKEYPWWL